VEYSFDIDIAGQFGIDEAIFIKNMQFWIIKNKSEGKNLREDRTWTYGSLKNFKRYFPFWTEKQLSGIIRNLLDFDIILKNNFNKIKYDRTIWYAFKDENEYIYKYNKELQHKKESSELENNTDKSLNLTILPNGQMDFTKRANGFYQTGEPIPDTESYTNTDKKDKSSPKSSNGKARFTDDSPFLKIALQLKEKVLLTKPHALIADSQIQKWANIVRVMVDRDQRAEVDIAKIIDLCHADEFWKHQILSMGTLREKWNEGKIPPHAFKPKSQIWVEYDRSVGY